MVDNFRAVPALFVVALLNMLAIANIPREISKGKEIKAFVSSAATIAALLMLFAIGIFPNIVYSNPQS